MSRPNAKGLELSFNKSTKRWCKTLNGKRRYFGSGTNASDQKSYRAALAKYRAFMDSEYEQERIIKLSQATTQRILDHETEAVEKWLKQAEQGFIHTTGSFLLSPEQLKKQPQHVRKLAAVDAKMRDLTKRSRIFELATTPAGPQRDQLLLGRSPSEYVAGLPPRQLAASVKHAAATTPTIIADYVDQYLKTREKAATSQAAVRSLSMHGYRSVKVGLKTFQEFAGNRVWSDEYSNEKLLADYRSFLEQQLNSGKYAAHIFNDKLKYLKVHMKWLYNQRLIPELPRNLQEVGVKARTIKQGHPLTLEQVQRLWAVAAPRERCWMALGLNCGYYSKDISDLIPKDLTVAPGYVARMRQKKDVPSKHLLWAVTCNLIEECRFKGQDAATKSLFLSKNHTVLNEAGRDLVGIFFKKLADRAKVKAVFSQFRDTGAEFVENYARQHTPYDPSLTQLYLAHRDNRTAQYYLSNDPEVMQVPALDQALQAMEKHFNLEHNLKDTAPPMEQDATK